VCASKRFLKMFCRCVGGRITDERKLQKNREGGRIT